MHGDHQLNCRAAAGTGPAGRLLVIGDIHGGYRALASLLTSLQPDRDDLVITLGDYIDRGPRSREVVSRLIGLQKETTLVALRGNHEEMILAWRQGDPAMLGVWLANGGLATIQSYGRGRGLAAGPDGAELVLARALEDPANLIRLIPREHWLFLEGCRDWFETEDYIFVHGGVEPDLDMARQPPEQLHWLRFNQAQRAHKSGKKVICGHAPRLNGQPEDLGHTLCIDTFLYGGQWLTGLDLTNGEYYQANNLGEVRVSLVGAGPP
jgi:serine/threonine protein phosphatase 1